MSDRHLLVAFRLVKLGYLRRDAHCVTHENIVSATNPLDVQFQSQVSGKYLRILTGSNAFCDGCFSNISTSGTGAAGAAAIANASARIGPAKSKT